MEFVKRLEVGTQYPLDNTSQISLFGDHVQKQLIIPRLAELELIPYKNQQRIHQHDRTPTSLFERRVPVTLRGKINDITAELVIPDVSRIHRKLRDRIPELCIAAYVIQGMVHSFGNPPEPLRVGFTHFAMRRANTQAGFVTFSFCDWRDNEIEQKWKQTMKYAILGANAGARFAPKGN